MSFQTWPIWNVGTVYPFGTLERCLIPRKPSKGCTTTNPGSWECKCINITFIHIKYLYIYIYTHEFGSIDVNVYIYTYTEYLVMFPCPFLVCLFWPIFFANKECTCMAFLGIAEYSTRVFNDRGPSCQVKRVCSLVHLVWHPNGNILCKHPFPISGRFNHVVFFQAFLYSSQFQDKPTCFHITPSLDMENAETNQLDTSERCFPFCVMRH